MCVQCVAKPSQIPAALTNIERFTEENSQTMLPPRLLLQRPMIRNVTIFGFAAFVTVLLINIVFLKYKTKPTWIISEGHFPVDVALGGT